MYDKPNERADDYVVIVSHMGCTILRTHHYREIEKRKLFPQELPCDQYYTIIMKNITFLNVFFLQMHHLRDRKISRSKKYSIEMYTNIIYLV